MNSKKIPGWVIVDIILVIAAIILRFIAVGYDFIAYALLFVAALIAAYRYFGKALKIILTFLVGAGMIYFIIVEVPVVTSARTDENPEADYLIVLGAGVNGSAPSLSLQNRLDAAYDYLVKYPDSTAIVTGGQGSGENITEADCMYNVLTGMGIAPERIIREELATSTKENFENSFELIQKLGGEPNGNVAVVSSEYHLYRAKLIAAAQNVDVKLVAAHTTYPIIKLNYFIREAFALTYLRVSGL